MNADLVQFALTAFGMLFVVINPIAVAPVFVAVTSGLSAAQRRSTLTRAVIAAFLVALFFLFVGRAFLSYMGVSSSFTARRSGCATPAFVPAIPRPPHSAGSRPPRPRGIGCGWCWTPAMAASTPARRSAAFPKRR